MISISCKRCSPTSLHFYLNANKLHGANKLYVVVFRMEPNWPKMSAQSGWLLLHRSSFCRPFCSKICSRASSISPVHHVFSSSLLRFYHPGVLMTKIRANQSDRRSHRVSEREGNGTVVWEGCCMYEQSCTTNSWLNSCFGRAERSGSLYVSSSLLPETHPSELDMSRCRHEQPTRCRWS